MTTFADRIAEARTGYLARTHARLDALALGLDKPDAATRERAAFLFHDIAGTAGVMGCAAIGDRARAIEGALDRLRIADDGVAHDETMRAGVAEIATLVEAARAA